MDKKMKHLTLVILILLSLNYSSCVQSCVTDIEYRVEGNTSNATIKYYTDDAEEIVVKSASLPWSKKMMICNFGYCTDEEIMQPVKLSLSAKNNSSKKVKIKIAIYKKGEKIKEKILTKPNDEAKISCEY